MSKFEIPYRVTEKQAKAAGETLARAFHDYPTMIYYYPDEDERSKKLPIFFEFFVRYGIMYGEVYGSSSNLEGIAIWLPLWNAELTEERLTKCSMSYRDGIKLPSVFNEEFSKKDEPIVQCLNRCHIQYADFFHWYLFPIGVDPEYQGNGHAGFLLRSKFEEIDSQNIPSYLETHKEKNVSLYQYFGYETVETGIISGTDLTFWAMLRKKD